MTAVPTPTKAGMYVPFEAYTRFGSGILNEVAISPDGKSYAIASSVGAAAYDLETHTVQYVISSGQWVQSVDYSPDGTRLATGTSWKENGVQIRDAGTGENISTLAAKNNVDHVRFSPDGKWIAAGTWDGDILIWDTQSLKLVKTLTGYPDFIYSIDFSPDGNRIMAIGRGYAAMVWDVKTGDVLANVRTGSFGGVFLPDGVQVAVAGSQNVAIMIWDVEKDLRVAEYKHPQKLTATALVSSPDGKWLYVGYEDGSVLELNADSLLMAHEFEGNGESVASIAISPSQDHLFIATANHSIIVWDMETREKISETTHPGHSGYISGLSISPDGRLLISGANDGRVYAWDPETNSAIHIDQGGQRRVEDVQFFPDGKRFINVTCNEGFFVINASDYSLIKAGSWGDGKVCYANSAVAVSHNTDILAIGTDAGGEEIRDNQYTRISRFFVTGGVTDLEFSPDDMYLAVAHNRKNGENFVSVIEVQSGEVINQITDYTDRVTDVEFSPDGKYLVSSSGSWFSDGEIIVWNMEKQRIVKTLPIGAHAIRFSPDGRYLARGGSWDFTITLFNTSTWQEEYALSGHSMLVYALEFSPDGTLLFSGSYDGTILAWLIE
jgi:WD40 repeat protein